MRTEKVSEPNAPQRVTLLYRGARLGAELLALLGEERLVNVISSPAELAKGGPPADVVVVDVPPQDRRAVCEQVRRQYHGPLIVLLSLGDNSRDLPADHSRVLLTRPFSMRDLSVALAGSRPTQPTLDPVGHLRLVPTPHGVQDRGRSDRVVPTVPRLVRRSWRDRRMLRVSAIAIVAALAFTGAFALVNRSNGCGSGCDELTGAGLTSPSNTTFQAVPMGPGTIASGGGTVASTTTLSSAGPVADGGFPTDAATGGAAQIAPTTAGQSAVPGPTAPPPDPTRPQTSAPPSTAPKTTATRASTTTTTTSTTTTTTTTTIPTEP